MLTREERQWLERSARSTREPARHGIRTKQLLAVAAGQSYTQAAELIGRKSGDAVSHVVAHLNRAGLHAMAPGTSSRRKPTYGVPEREQILATARRPPEPERTRSAPWSLKLLQRSLRHTAPRRFGRIST